MSTNWKFRMIQVGACLSAATLTSYLVWKTWIRKKKLYEEERARETMLEQWNDSFFFPTYYPENPTSAYQRFLTCLKSAKKSIRVCVMTISFREIIDVLIEKYNEGVEVQIYTTDFSRKRLQRRFASVGCGIEARSKWTKYSTQMHHKFVIIDDLAVLTGSMNWTQVSVSHQQENILRTTNPAIVSKFCQEFSKVWKIFDPV